MQSKRGCSGVWIAALAVAADQISKALVVRSGRETALLPGMVAIHPTANTGMAFSMFSGNGLLLTILTVALVAVLAGWLILSKRSQPSGLRTGLWLIIGGGLGNLIDRIAFGHVIDFIELEFIHFAVFNVADMAICIGAAITAISVILDERRKEHPHE